MICKYSDLIRLIEERVGPIIERGDMLFNNLRNIQQRRMIRNTASSNAIPDLINMRTYEDLIIIEQSMLEEAKGGYNQEMINQIRQSKFWELSQEDKRNITDDAIWPICWDNYKSSDQVKVLGCAHIYHVKWIGEWLKRNKNCPLCKKRAINNCL